MSRHRLTVLPDMYCKTQIDRIARYVFQGTDWPHCPISISRHRLTALPDMYFKAQIDRIAQYVFRGIDWPYCPICILRHRLTILPDMYFEAQIDRIAQFVFRGTDWLHCPIHISRHRLTVLPDMYFEAQIDCICYAWGFTWVGSGWHTKELPATIRLTHEGVVATTCYDQVDTQTANDPLDSSGSSVEVVTSSSSCLQ